MNAIRYSDAKVNALDGVNLRIAPGEHIALVGPSGGGKTTVSRLGTRFWDTTKGTIAKAFLKDVPIILLDEATASLDVENETKIQSALSKLIGGKTVLLIAHRICTVSGADKIVVLENGEVSECGAMDERYAQNGTCHRMAQLHPAAE